MAIAFRKVSYAKRWVRYRDQAGLSKATLYELRHTFVSMVKQLPEGLIKPLVRHSKSMDTFGTYGHELTGEMQSTAKLVQDIFSGYIKLASRNKNIASAL